MVWAFVLVRVDKPTLWGQNGFMTEYKPGDAVRSNVRVEERAIVFGVGEGSRDTRIRVLQESGIVGWWPSDAVEPDPDGPCLDWVRTPDTIELPEPEKFVEWAQVTSKWLAVAPAMDRQSWLYNVNVLGPGDLCFWASDRDQVCGSDSLT